MRIATTTWERLAARRTMSCCASATRNASAAAPPASGALRRGANGVDTVQFPFVDRAAGELAKQRLGLGVAPLSSASVASVVRRVKICCASVGRSST